MLEDIFDEFADDENELSGEAFEALLRDCGYTRSEVHWHFRELFVQLATLPAAAQAAAAHPASKVSPRRMCQRGVQGVNGVKEVF